MPDKPTIREVPKQRAGPKVLADLVRRPFGVIVQRRPATPKGAVRTRRPIGDFVMAGLGITLGVTCALFPWYIFLHPKQFALDRLHFGIHVSPVLQPSSRQNDFMEAAGLPGSHAAALDFFPTGTITDKAPKIETDQPYPGDAEANRFDLVEVANGRAMIEDADGVWMVGIGSSLPDDSRVAAIERRAGRWVLVTTKNKVVAMAD